MNVQKVGSYLLTILILLNLIGLMSADAQGNIGNAVCQIVVIVQTVMGAAMLVLIVLAAIVYAAGQVMGAETRARANVWATSMFVGAVVGALIYIVVPVFLSYLLYGDTSLTASGCSGGTNGIPALQ